MKTAILVDGGFFIKRYRAIYGRDQTTDPKLVAKSLYAMCMRHLQNRQQELNYQLYRIFFYDCPPLTKRVHNPISGRVVNFGKSTQSIFRQSLHNELSKMRKVALRLGHLSSSGDWQIKASAAKKLFKKEISIQGLTEDDVLYDIRQKGVDMRIGADITSLAYKKQVDQIVLIAGDSDFVPVAKLARREGIDFILDPMWNPINPELHKHIDGLRSTCTNPSKTNSSVGQDEASCIT